ncbi:MAG TPA: hypothetical protein PLI53_06870 [Geobacteraceae bacterium]|nr:hypothetical protein [Geobacteraceae bacterium]
MATFYSATKLSNSIDPKFYLGKTTEEIIQIIGPPFVSYMFHNEETFLYETGDISTVVFHNGLVVRCDEQIETRSATRVNPEGMTPIMVNGKKNQRFLLKDISFAGAAILHQNEPLFSVGKRIDISFALPIEGIFRFVTIPCLIHDKRHDNQEQVSIVLFDHTDTPWKKRLLSRYVTLRTAQTQLGLKKLFI